MKKIQLILLLVLLAITGQVGAQIIPTTITNGQFDPGTVFYRINFTPSIFQHYYITIGSDVTTTTTKAKATLFAFVGNDTDGYRIYAKGDATKYIYLTSTTSDVNVDNVHYGTSDTYDKFKIRKNGSGYTIYQYGPRSSSIPTSLNYVPRSTLQTWSNSESLSDNNCRVAFEAVEMSLLYQYTFSEGTVNQVVYGTIGSAYPNPATAPAFCTITGSKPSGNVTAGGTETATFNATWDGPLEYSSDLANAKWYLMTLGYEKVSDALGQQKQVFRFKGTGSDITLPTADYTFTYSSKDQFAFVGNPLDGFQVINRSAGNPRLVANADGTGNPSFANSPSSAQSDRWDIYNVTVGPASSITVPGDKRFGLNLHGNNAKKLNRNGASYNVVYWSNHDNGSTFTVSQADLPSLALNVFDGKTYASLYVDYPVEVTSENVTVYTGTVSGNTLQMTEANDKIIPANVGVVLVGNTTSETSAALSIANSAGTVSHGVIEGSITDVPIGGLQDLYLVLGVSNEEPQSVGFFRPTIATIPAYRAYIPKSATQSVRGLYFNFDGETTSIDPTVLTPAKEETIYDLGGRRVNKAVKGIYIKNGKKIYVK